MAPWRNVPVEAVVTMTSQRVSQALSSSPPGPTGFCFDRTGEEMVCPFESLALAGRYNVSSLVPPPHLIITL